MFELTMPSWLVNMTSAREGQGGLVGTMFMALTFTLISFACVAPFYGAFIGLTAAAQSATDWLKLSLGALAFSVTFASPFFLLALFPSLLRKLPKSGSWMNTVKVVMAFLELAAAIKFLRAFEVLYYARAKFLTYDLVLGMYVIIAFLCGLYLLSLYRLPHDHDGVDNDQRACRRGGECDCKQATQARGLQIDARAARRLFDNAARPRLRRCARQDHRNHKHRRCDEADRRAAE